MAGQDKVGRRIRGAVPRGCACSLWIICRGGTRGLWNVPGRHTGGHGGKRVRFASGHVNEFGTHITEATSLAHSTARGSQIRAPVVTGNPGDQWRRLRRQLSWNHGRFRDRDDYGAPAPPPAGPPQLGQDGPQYPGTIGGRAEIADAVYP